MRRWRYDADSVMYAARHSGYGKKGTAFFMKISRDTGIEHNVLRRYLSGEIKQPNGETLMALADCFGCSIEDFFEEVDG